MKISIAPGGKATDQIMRYIYALNLQRAYPDSDIVNYENPSWGIKTENWDEGDSTPYIIGPDNLFSAFDGRDFQHDHVRISWPALQHRFCVNARDDLRRHLDLLPLNNEGERAIADDEILAHVRLDDITRKVHRDYWPLAIDWYRQVSEIEGKRLVFIGELFKHQGYFENIQKVIPNSRMMPPGSVIEDFLRIYTAKSVIISLSSYAWLSSWLSQSVERIHVPYCGFLSHQNRPDIDLFDFKDERYHFHIMPNLDFNAVEDLLQFNLDVQCSYTQIADRTTVWKYHNAEKKPSRRKRVSKRIRKFRNKLFR